MATTEEEYRKSWLFCQFSADQQSQALCSGFNAIDL